jgi:hypothetical protein
MKHRDQVLDLLRKQIGNDAEVEDIRLTAEEVATKWVNPVSGGKAQTNGLIYGLVQSGNTGVLTATGAIGADEGYRTILILTSDIDPLYEQTLGRVQEAFPGIDIIGKNDFKDPDAFLQRIKSGTTAIVTTKNSSRLKAIIENLKRGGVRGLSCLIIDDEADQASLNTKASREDGAQSAINERLTDLRAFFDKNTYLQVTATPQALFLQAPGHDFRPAFTVLSHPGKEYVGGEDFFGEGSKLVREFDIQDIEAMLPGSQPMPQMGMPKSLLRALDTFVVGATFKRKGNPDQNCAFLCHVSTKTGDHAHIVDLLRRYKTDLTDGVSKRSPSVISRLRESYDDLATTHSGVGAIRFDDLLEPIQFYSRGINVKLVNGETDEDVAVKSPLNLFVGGNKLGRGVTIKNLLVSYYGRNPKKPQADTVLQHARMYGYRRKDIGLLRLFLPRELHTVFKAINKMERGLRELISDHPSEAFRGVFIEGSLSATRRNVLAPGAVGVYTGGGTYNPAQILRTSAVAANTEKIDKALLSVASKTYVDTDVDTIVDLIQLTMPDDEASERIWDPLAVAGSLRELERQYGQTGARLYVDRDRRVRENRIETQGILTGGEGPGVPKDKLTLFMLRMSAEVGEYAAWWPQIRFADGGYAFAFAV